MRPIVAVTYFVLLTICLDNPTPLHEEIVRNMEQINELANSSIFQIVYSIPVPKYPTLFKKTFSENAGNSSNK